MPITPHNKRCQIFGSEEPNLIAIRAKSYWHKNQILWAEDLAAFSGTAIYDDYQRLTKVRFLSVVSVISSVSEANKGRAKIGFIRFPQSRFHPVGNAAISSGRKNQILLP